MRLPFRLAAPARVRLWIHDLAGREVRRILDDEFTAAGSHSPEWRANDARGSRVRPGVYLAVLEAGGRRFSRRVAIVR